MYISALGHLQYHLNTADQWSAGGLTQSSCMYPADPAYPVDSAVQLPLTPLGWSTCVAQCETLPSNLHAHHASPKCTLLLRRGLQYTVHTIHVHIVSGSGVSQGIPAGELCRQSCLRKAIWHLVRRVVHNQAGTKTININGCQRAT